MRRGIGHYFALWSHPVVHEHVPRLLAMNVESFLQEVASLLEIAQTTAMIVQAEIARKALGIAARNEKVVFADIVAHDRKDWIAVIGEHLRPGAEANGGIARH